MSSILSADFYRHSAIINTEKIQHPRRNRAGSKLKVIGVLTNEKIIDRRGKHLEPSFEMFPRQP